MTTNIKLPKSFWFADKEVYEEALRLWEELHDHTNVYGLIHGILRQNFPPERLKAKTYTQPELSKLPVKSFIRKQPEQPLLISNDELNFGTIQQS